MGNLIVSESRTRNPKVTSSSLCPVGIEGGGCKCTALSLHPQYQDEVPLSKAPNPQLPQHICLPTAPGVCSRCVSVLLDGLNAEHKMPSMGNHTWPYVTSLSLYI